MSLTDRKVAECARRRQGERAVCGFVLQIGLPALGSPVESQARLIEDRDGSRERRSIMTNEISAVLEFGAPAPGETATMMERQAAVPHRFVGFVGRSQGRTFRHCRDRRPLPRCIRRWAHSRRCQLPTSRDETPKPPHTSTAARSMSSIATGLAVMLRPRAHTSSRGWDFAPRSCSAGSIGGDATGIR